MIYSLAVDIGASSGRVILGSLDKNQLQMQEIHRFDNRLIEKSGQFCWDIQALFEEIKTGIKKSRNLHGNPTSIGIDTWAVDFVLLDEHDQLLTDAVSYRDPRTDGIMEEVHTIVPKERIYEKTGIQFLQFNTIYQLYALKKQNPDIFRKAKTFLMIPDYLHFLLTGKKVNEYTNATTTQLVNAYTKNWDVELIRTLGFPIHIFQSIQLPKTNIGSLKKELVTEFGFNLDVILPGTHDTASAIMAIPEPDHSVYISSGTWSLMGIEHEFPLCNEKALHYNVTNEGGVDYRFRILKNIMGLWMIQEVRRNCNERYSFADLVEESRKFPEFSSIIHVDDPRFLKPDHMIQEIQHYCQENNQPIPESIGEVAKCIYDSLAESYKHTVDELEALFEINFQKINIIGGGSQNEHLNQLVANVTGKTVVAGPVEATAIGNLIVQMLAKKEIASIQEAKHIISQSFELKKYYKA